MIIVLDDTGFGQLGCYGSPIATPNFDALAAGGLLYTNMHTTALCSPSRSCIITGRNHHANGMAAINELATGYPGYNGSIPFENGFLSEMLLAAGLQHLHDRQVPPDAVGVRVGGRPVRPLAAGPRVRALLRVPGRRHQPVVSGPGLRQPPGRAAAHPRAGLPPDRGPGRQGHPVPRRRQAGRPGQAVLPALLPRRRRTRRTTCPRSGPTGTRASSTTAGTPTGERVFARQKELGIMPADAELSRHDPDVPGLGVAVRRRSGGWLRPDDGGVRRLPVATPTTTSAGSSTS